VNTTATEPWEDRPPAIRSRIVIALFALSFVLRFAYFYLDDLTRQEPGTFLRRVLEEGTGHLTALALFPLIVMAERTFPVDQGRWRRVWYKHLAIYVGFSAIHTTLIAATRAVVFPAAGLGAYDYGVMSVRYVMESAQDFFAYVTFVGILTLVRGQQRLRARERREAELARDAANAQLEALSMRLQPHFLFNALNTISSTVYVDPVAADEMIGRLGDLLRHSLGSAGRREVRVADEVETLHTYLSFVNARFGDRLTVRVDVDPAAHDMSVPAFLLQPLVENAVHHGAARDQRSSEIFVDVSVRGRDLLVTVENDTAADRDSSSGLGTGLATTRDRLRLLHGGLARLETSEANGRFRVSVTLPAHALAAHSDIAFRERARAHR
jgi:hypothetical protein